MSCILSLLDDITEIDVPDIRDEIKKKKNHEITGLSPHLYNFINDIHDLMPLQLVGGCLDSLDQGHSTCIGAFQRMVENFFFFFFP